MYLIIPAFKPSFIKHKFCWSLTGATNTLPPCRSSPFTNRPTAIPILLAASFVWPTPAWSSETRRPTPSSRCGRCPRFAGSYETRISPNSSRFNTRPEIWGLTLPLIEIRSLPRFSTESEVIESFVLNRLLQYLSLTTSKSCRQSCVPRLQIRNKNFAACCI
jgi:hypothetical protein